jgi:outer membrane lipoprotein carrier protein
MEPSPASKENAISIPMAIPRKHVLHSIGGGIWAHRARIALTAAIVLLLAACYRYRFLPERADILLDYFLYMSAATTFTPLPTPPVIIHTATRAPVLVVALVGALGTVVAYLLEYSVLGHFLAAERLGRVRKSRAFERLASLFDRLPFLALVVAAFLPLPVDGVRLMAIARRYDRRRFAAAAFLGRLPRYLLLASLGYGLKGLFASVVGGMLMLFAPQPVAAQGATAEAQAGKDPALTATLNRMDQALVGLRDLKGDFRQERWSPAFPDPEEASGELWFRRPGDLVLEYEKPLEQHMLVDSSGVWIYLVAEKQAQRYPFSTPAERDAALAVLWQPSAMLGRLYEIRPATALPAGEKAEGKAGEWLTLVPRDSDLAQALVRAHIRLAKKSGLADCVIVEKQDGERVRLEVKSIAANPGLPGSRFQFKPPPGVEVVRF